MPEIALKRAREVGAFDLHSLNLEERSMPMFMRLPVTREGIGNVLIRGNEQDSTGAW